MNVASSRNGRHRARWAVVALALCAPLVIATEATAERVTLPILCTKGPSGQRFDAAVTLPQRAELGSTYWVRIDGASSGRIAHFGLNHLHDISVDYVLPPGAAYVEGSAQLVAGTGTANVVPTARLRQHRRVLTLSLPGKVDNGSDYTPPSIRFQLRAVGAPGSAAVVGFSQLRLVANAFLVGDIAISCDPSPKPAPIGTTLITSSGRPSG